ncbi:MAG TPA: hypothetical protein VFT72_03820 [Opitutaceae bacterium]|nr:hypothetical protein [Opitutaceae bacterium]
MKKLIILAVISAMVSAARADGVDVLRSGLQAFQANGVEALLGTWYDSKDQLQLDAVRSRFTKAAQGLGGVLDTEVFAPRMIGRHVQRVYGVIYFAERPLWVRAEYYMINGHGGFISLEVSRNANDILPLEVGLSGR